MGPFMVQPFPRKCMFCFRPYLIRDTTMLNQLFCSQDCEDQYTRFMQRAKNALDNYLPLREQYLKNLVLLKDSLWFLEMINDGTYQYDGEGGWQKGDELGPIVMDLVYQIRPLFGRFD